VDACLGDSPVVATAAGTSLAIDGLRLHFLLRCGNAHSGGRAQTFHSVAKEQVNEAKAAAAV
jgi:hypothetical protein